MGFAPGIRCHPVRCVSENAAGFFGFCSQVFWHRRKICCGAKMCFLRTGVITTGWQHGWRVSWQPNMHHCSLSKSTLLSKTESSLKGHYNQWFVKFDVIFVPKIHQTGHHSVERADKRWHGLGGCRRRKVSPVCFKAPHPSKSSQIQFCNFKRDFATAVKVQLGQLCGET